MWPRLLPHTKDMSQQINENMCELHNTCRHTSINPLRVSHKNISCVPFQPEIQNQKGNLANGGQPNHIDTSHIYCSLLPDHLALIHTPETTFNLQIKTVAKPSSHLPQYNYSVCKQKHSNPFSKRQYKVLFCLWVMFILPPGDSHTCFYILYLKY